MRIAENEGRLRSFLAVAIISCVGLAAWTGGCGRDTVVQPDASSSDDLGAETGDASGPEDLGRKDLVPNEDAQAMACCTGSELARCLDATQVIACEWRFDSPAACLDSPGLSSYGHVWLARGCDKGCDPARGNCRP